MPINLKSLFNLSVAGAVIVTLGACKAADKGQGALKSESLSALNLSKSEGAVFAKYFATDPCEVDEMEALGALAGLGLGENGANGFSFESRDVKGGLVTYKDFAAKENDTDETSFFAKSVTFHCPKMGEEAPTFSRVDMKNITVLDPEDNVEITADTLNIAKPTFEAAQAFVKSISNPSSNPMENIGFGALSITGAKIKSDDLNGTMDAMSWGEERDENGKGTADLTLESINLTMPSQTGGQDVVVTFDGASARNMKIGDKIAAGRTLSPDEMVGGLLGNLNAFDKPYDELLIERLKVEAEGFAVNFGGIEGKTSEKSGVVTIQQSLKPTQIQIKEALGENPAFKQNYDILKSLNFENIEMSGSSTTTLNSADDSITVSDGLFTINDALQLNFEYGAEGMTELTEKLGSLSGSPSGADVIGLYEPLKLRNFRMTLEDNSIVSRGLALASQMTGQSEKNIKRSLGMLVFASALAAENEVQAEVYSETMEAFADFVKKGGTMTIEANPPTPFSLSPLISGKGADVDPDALGFSASQEGGAE